jgi:hypothetical protein
MLEAVDAWGGVGRWGRLAESSEEFFWAECSETTGFFRAVAVPLESTPLLLPPVCGSNKDTRSDV